MIHYYITKLQNDKESNLTTTLFIVHDSQYRTKLRT